MKISNVYIQEDKYKQYTYRFEFKNLNYKLCPSLMLHYWSNTLSGSLLSQLYYYNSLRKVKPYENIRG